jgi:hypothetical protein
MRSDTSCDMTKSDPMLGGSRGCGKKEGGREMADALISR